MKDKNPKSILMVEDDYLISMGLTAELKASGYSVCGRVATGEAAVEAVAKEKPDVILMDIRLAGKIDGIEAAEKIREFSDASLLFLTGYQDSATETRARRLKPLAYLIKPVNMNTLRNILDSNLL